MSCKRANGQYYTRGNPFSIDPFLEWAKRIELPSKHVLEPFAGSNNIIQTLQSIGQCQQFSSYDIAPTNKEVQSKDTISSFPRGFEVCITNPPWLARNSATRRGLLYPDTRHDDLYKHCLELCLSHCKNVAALIPASFLQSGIFRERLSSYVLLHDRGMFNDTDNPVCLALFDEKASSDIAVYYDNMFVGHLRDLETKAPAQKLDRVVRFNDPQGKLGFIAFDNTREPSIRFCEIGEIQQYSVKVSSRFFTRISGEFDDIPELVKQLNRKLDRFRKDTYDIFLTPFKGIRKDGHYRRRMDFALARRLICEELNQQGRLFD